MRFFFVLFIGVVVDDSYIYICTGNSCVTQDPSVTIYFCVFEDDYALSSEAGGVDKTILAPGIGHQSLTGKTFGPVFFRRGYPPKKKRGISCSRLSAVSRACVRSIRQTVGNVVGGPSGGCRDFNAFSACEWRRFPRIVFQRELSLN